MGWGWSEGVGGFLSQNLAHVLPLHLTFIHEQKNSGFQGNASRPNTHVMADVKNLMT